MTKKVFHIEGIQVLNMKPEFHGMGYDNISHNLSKTKKRLEKQEENKETLVIVGYGPSLQDSYKYLYKCKNILSMSGAHDFLLSKGIMPTYHIDCDPRPHKAEFTKNPQKEIKYLMASSCHANTIDQLLDYDLTLWNLETTEEFKYPEGEQCFPGMGCVGLQALLIAHVLGYRKIVLLGMDFSFRQESTHAAYHPRSKEQGDRLLIALGEYDPKKEIKDYEIFETTVLLTVYAKEMYLWMSKSLTDCEFEIIGTGLFPAYVMYEVEKAQKQWQQIKLPDSDTTMLSVTTADLNLKTTS